MSFKAYTDYPIEDGTYDAGVKEVEVLSYDRDKYCTVLRNGFEDEVKLGYLFTDPELKRRPGKAKVMSLPESPEDEPKTRLQVFKDLRLKRKVKTSYMTEVVQNPETHRGWLGDRRRFSTLKEALQYVKQTMHTNKSVTLEKWSDRYVTSSDQTLFSTNEGVVMVFTNRKGRSGVSTKTLRKAGIL